jgi:predicted Fe-Mo cluster-binding NifX family protein
MKIAAVTDDGKTISAHFGRAMHFAVVTVENGRVTTSELREKAGHREFQDRGSHRDEIPVQPTGYKTEPGHGTGRHSAEKHRRMFAAIPDCQIVLARGMGQGAYTGLQQAGLRPVLTDIKGIDEAVQAVIDRTIEDHPERLH